MSLYNSIKEICPDTIENEPMKKHTTFRIGGPCDFYIAPENNEKLLEVLSFLKKNNIKYMMLGNGSNMLVSDKGIEGAVIDISKYFKDVKITGNIIEAGSGILLSSLAKKALSASLSGLEKASGIPGTLGGAIYMNAGAYGFEMKDVLRSVTYIDENMKIRTEQAENLKLGYRSSIFTGRHCAILSGKMELSPADKEYIKSEMADYNERRTSKQPLNMPSAGSTFKRPENNFAGALIEEAGLKGYSIGGAEISEKHAGFVVNKGDATAKDVMDLIEYVQRVVEEKSSVLLEPEVRIIGR